ncbi:hypothetical protein MTO96_011829 [Rhipicephalus appendiculatus]
MYTYTARTRLGHGFGGLLTRVSRAVHYGRWGSVDNDGTHVMGAAERVRARPPIVSRYHLIFLVRPPFTPKCAGPGRLRGPRRRVRGPSFRSPKASAPRASVNEFTTVTAVGPQIYYRSHAAEPAGLDYTGALPMPCSSVIQASLASL